MDFIELKARAKVNLSLDVIEKRSDGYHNVRMLMQTLALHDTVLLECRERGIEVSCSHIGIPEGEGNIAYRAAKLLMDEFSIHGGIKIKIVKRIPVAAGLAGGSSDAAAVMKGMNSLYSLNINDQELMRLGKKIGADVPYCMMGGTALAEGIGDLLTPLNPCPSVPVLLIKPSISVSTPWVYNHLQLGSISSRPDTELLVGALQKGDIKTIAQRMKNVLETVTVAQYPVVAQAKKRLMELGAQGSMMSGSGPTVFGIFTDEKCAEEAYASVCRENWECILTCTV